MNSPAPSTLNRKRPGTVTFWSCPAGFSSVGLELCYWRHSIAKWGLCQRCHKQWMNRIEEWMWNICPLCDEIVVLDYFKHCPVCGWEIVEEEG